MNTLIEIGRETNFQNAVPGPFIKIGKNGEVFSAIFIKLQKPLLMGYNAISYRGERIKIGKMEKVCEISFSLP